MKARDLEFAAIDFESAGVRRGETDVPIQVGIAVMSGGVIRDTFKSYLRCDRPVAWTSRRVHGISEHDLADAPTLLELWPELRSRLAGRWVVSHGAGTEKRFLRAFPAHGFGPWVDTLQLFRAAAPEAPSHALSALAAYCGCEAACLEITPDFRWHDALCDAAATLVLLRFLIERFELDADALLNPDASRYRAFRSSRFL